MGRFCEEGQHQVVRVSRAATGTKRTTSPLIEIEASNYSSRGRELMNKLLVTVVAAAHWLAFLQHMLKHPRRLLLQLAALTARTRRWSSGTSSRN